MPNQVVYGPATGTIPEWIHELTADNATAGTPDVPAPTAGVVSSFAPPDETVDSLTPVARWDVVGSQRFSSSFKAGIVAFSKPGIYGIEVTPSGQGYGGAPLTATSMTYNDRTAVWEYWVAIDPADFTSDGVITLAAIVYGDDGGRRTLDSLTLYVDKGGLSQPKAWVTVGGNDSTGTINNSSAPYLSVAGALVDLQATYGTCSGAVVYVGEGEWELGSTTITTTGEWLSIVAASGAAQANVIFHGGGSVTSTTRIRFYNLTLLSDGTNDLWLQGWPDPEPTWLWVDTCRVVGSGRWTENSSPIYRNENSFCTDSYITNTDITMRFFDLVRNVDVEAIGDDCCFVCECMINVTLKDQDPMPPGQDPLIACDHADGFQWAGTPMENVIVYGWHATDIHYQGLFARMAPGSGTHSNSAFVNMLIEARYPRRSGSDGQGAVPYETMAFFGAMDHILIWHCTSINDRGFNVYDEPAGVSEFQMHNCSFVGNLFGMYVDWDQGDAQIAAYAAPGNSENNEFIHNHYIESYLDGVGGIIYSKSPDSVSGGSQTLGDPDVVTTQDAADYGTPNATSPLLNRLSSKRVPIDVYENERDATPDVGAVERV